jgi:hypothetical protein
MSKLVIPTKVGIQDVELKYVLWTPAYARVTKKHQFPKQPNYHSQFAV